MMMIYSCSKQFHVIIISLTEKIPTSSSRRQSKWNPKSFKPLKFHISENISSKLLHDKTSISSKKDTNIKIVTVTFRPLNHFFFV